MRQIKKLTAGKLEHKFLKQLIAGLPQDDRSIVIPPGIGMDAAGLKIGKKLIAITTDPITFCAANISTYSVAVNINDVACLGCKPRWYLACLLLPVGTTRKQVIDIYRKLTCELQRYNIKAIGGHTEITSTVTTPIIIGQLIGEAIGAELLSAQNGQPGDQIFLWRSVAIEGTALLATTKQKILQQYLSAKKIKAMQNLLYRPGICIWPLVKKLVPCQGLVALHDITEGGIATALHELADASKLGVKVSGIPLRKETQELVKIFKFNPLGLLASGSLLILCRPTASKRIIQKIGTQELTLIGELTKNNTRTLVQNGKATKLPRFAADEIIQNLT